MAIAKSVAKYRVWGITRYGFASSSSSLLYSLLLSTIYRVFGVNDVTPLILNIIFATLSICFIFYFLRQERLKSLYISIVLLFIIFFNSIASTHTLRHGTHTTNINYNTIC